MKRRLLTAAALLSLILCLGSLGLWVRSQFATDSFSGPLGSGRVIYVASTTGELRCWLWTNQFYPVPWTFKTQPSRSASPSRTSGRRATWLGGWPRYERTLLTYMSGVGRSLQLPYWLLVLILSILPAAWYWQRRREKRQTRGFSVAIKKEAR